jgi:hypothetical protein
MPEIAHTTREVLEVLSKAEEPMTTKAIYVATSFGSLEQLCKCLCAMRQRLYVERTVNNDRKNLYTIAAKGQLALGLRVSDLMDEEERRPFEKPYSPCEKSYADQEDGLSNLKESVTAPGAEAGELAKRAGVTKQAIRDILPVPLLAQDAADVEVSLFYIRSDGVLVLETKDHGALRIPDPKGLIEYLWRFKG